MATDRSSERHLGLVLERDHGNALQARGAVADVWVVWLVAFTTHGQGIGGSPTVMIAPKLPWAPTPVITPWAGSQLPVPLRPALPHTSM